MNLREICTAALEEVSGINVPTSFAHNGNLTAKLCTRLATTAGRHYALTYRWNALLVEYAFETIPGVAEYGLPPGFHAFSSLTHWDNTNLNRVKGPVSTVLWQALRRGEMIAPSFDKYFFLTTQRRTISLWPTPTAKEGIYYWYYTNYWVDANFDGAGELDRFADDSNLSLIDSDLITADIKWRFRKAKGLEWEAELAEAYIIRDALLVADTGKDILDFGTTSWDDFGGGGNIPASGFGGGGGSAMGEQGPPGPIGPPGPPGAPGPTLTASDTAPLDPVPNQIWWESDTGKLFVWYDDGTSAQWVETGHFTAP